MFRLNLFSRHAFFSDNVDAFVDGELRGADFARFQAHLGRCERCSDAVAEARILKSSFNAAPRRAVPRSFVLTPAMVAETPARQAQDQASPRFLGLARVAAAVSVVAFLSVFVVSALNPSDDDSTNTASPLSERNSVPVAAEDSAGGAAPATSQATSAYSVASPTAVLVPATSGGVSGAAVPSVPPDAATPGQQLAPLPNDNSGASKSAGSPESTALGDAVSVAPAATAGAKDSGDGFPWVIAFGCLAGAMVGVLLVAETRRRQRS